MAANIDLYAVLSIERGASTDEVRAAYRRAARASHPDLHPGDASALDRFKQVQVAYDILGDAHRRSAYDATLIPSGSTHRPHAGATTGHGRAPVRPPAQEAPVSLARELGETVAAIRVMARRSGFKRRVRRLIRYLESL